MAQHEPLHIILRQWPGIIETLYLVDTDFRHKFLLLLRLDAHGHHLHSQRLEGFDDILYGRRGHMVSGRRPDDTLINFNGAKRNAYYSGKFIPYCSISNTNSVTVWGLSANVLSVNSIFMADGGMPFLSIICSTLSFKSGCEN